MVAKTHPSIIAIEVAIEKETGVKPNAAPAAVAPESPEAAAPAQAPSASEAPKAGALTFEQLEQVVTHWEKRAASANGLTTSVRQRELADAVTFEREHPELFQPGQVYDFTPGQQLRYSRAMATLEKTDDDHPNRTQDDMRAAMELIRQRQSNPVPADHDHNWLKMQTTDKPDFLQGIDFKELILGFLDLLGLSDMLGPFVDKIAPGYNHSDVFTDMFSNIYNKSLKTLNDETYTGGTEKLESLVTDEVQALIDSGVLVFDDAADQQRFLDEIKISIQKSYEQGFDRATFVNRMHEVAEQLNVRQAAPATLVVDATPAAAATETADYEDGAALEGSIEVDTSTLHYMPLMNDDGSSKVLDLDQIGDAFQNSCFTSVTVGGHAITNSAEFSMDDIANQLGSRQFHIATLEDAEGNVYAHKLTPANDPSHPGIHINSHDYQAEIDAVIESHGQKIAAIDAELARLTLVTFAEKTQTIAPDMIAEPITSGRIENGQFIQGQPVTLETLAKQFGTEELQMRAVMVGGRAAAIEISKPGEASGQGVMFEINDFQNHLIRSRDTHLEQNSTPVSRYTDPAVLPARGALAGGFNTHATGLSLTPAAEQGNDHNGHITGFNVVASTLTVSGVQLANTLGGVSTLQASADGGFDEGPAAGNLIVENAQYATATLRDEDGPVAYQFDSGNGNPVIVAATGDVPLELRSQIASATPDTNAPSLRQDYGLSMAPGLAGPGMAA